MPGVYQLTELVGTSPDSYAEATKNAIAEISKTVRKVDWFEVTQMRGAVKNGKVAEFQVTLKAGFRIER